MVLNLSTFAVLLKNRNIIFKIRRSKVTDYAALRLKFLNYIAFQFRKFSREFFFASSVKTYLRQ